VELVRSGTIGKVGLVQATFSFDAPFAADNRLWNRELGGGGILDVGGYTTSWARLIAGAIDGKRFLDPVEVQGSAVFHPQTGVDMHAIANLVFANGMLAQVSCGVGLGQENVVRIYGSEGWLTVISPYLAGRNLLPTKVLLQRPGAPRPEEILVKPDRTLFAYEADAFAQAVWEGEREVPAMTLDDTLGNMATLDRWLASARGASLSLD
jgi:predicted dehydrogenase